MGKKHITFNVDEEIKKQFGIECMHNGVNMSDTVQNMMENFAIASKKMREAKEETSDKVDGAKIEFINEQ